MGKIDDMRRQREQQFADAAQREAKAAKAAPVLPASAPSAPASAPAAKPAVRGEVTTTGSKRGASKGEADEGKCPDCGKTKPLANGVMASHQKGFGKACSGSRKPPL